MNVLRRAFHNAAANWQLILLRAAESIALSVLMIGGLIVSALPFLVWLGVDLSLSSRPDQVFERLLENPILLLVGFAGTLLLFGVVVAIAVALHSFVQAGTIAIYAAGETNGGNGPVQGVDRSFRAFDVDRFLREGRRGWWPVFVIYNIIWGAYGLLLLIPLAPAAVAIVVWRDAPPAIVIGCLTLILVFIFAILGALVAGFWCQVAATLTITHDLPARAAIRETFPLLRSRLSDFVIAVGLRIAFGGGVEVMFMSVYFAIGMVSSVPGLSLATFPVHAVTLLVHASINVALTSWMVAAFTSIAVSQRRQSIVVRPDPALHG